MARAVRRLTGTRLLGAALALLPILLLRVLCSGGLALLVDGAGGRPGGGPPDLSLAPVLTVRFR